MVMPLQDDDVATTFERHIQAIKDRLLEKLEATEYFVSIKDLGRIMNVPREYPYADKFHIAKSVNELVGEGKLIKVGANFYTTPENFIKYKNKAK